MPKIAPLGEKDRPERIASAFKSCCSPLSFSSFFFFFTRSSDSDAAQMARLGNEGFAENKEAKC